MFCKEDRCDLQGCFVPRLKFGGYKMKDVIVKFTYRILPFRAWGAAKI